MSALTTAPKPVTPNRRRRVRHKIQTPAYASFTGESSGAMLDLHEIVNISEGGASIQCPEPLEVGKRLNLCLDLAECPDHIYTTGQVIWSHSDGRVGLKFSELPPFSLFRLREWLFLNAMAGVANADEAVVAATLLAEQAPVRPNYTDTLAAVTAVQREAEAFGADLTAALPLIASRAQNLLNASVAIALSDSDPGYMICRASSGPDAPPVGVKLQVGSGFSGECVKAGRLLRCDDSETDDRVDRESCRDLGIRSLLAVPVRVGQKSVGILEAFSPQPLAFGEGEGRVLQRFAETVLAAVNRAARAQRQALAELQPAPVKFAPNPGSVLFASTPAEPSPVRVTDKSVDRGAPRQGMQGQGILSQGMLGQGTKDQPGSGGIKLPRSLLMLLVLFLITTALALGYISAGWMQSDVLPWMRSKLQRAPGHLPTVLASSERKNVPNSVSVETATLDQLQQMAAAGNPNAQNSLGLRYVNGDGVKPSEREAVRWFTKAAEQGNVSAQSKLGAIYFRGREVQQNFNQAYFWMVLARASGDQTSKVLAPVVATHLTPEQADSIALDADRWLQQHMPAPKPTAGR